MRLLSLSLMCCAIVVILSIATGGVQPAKLTPEEVVTRYFERVKEQGLGSVADMMHPDELTKFRRMVEPVVLESLAEKDDTFAIYADAQDPTRISPMDDVKFMNTFMSWASQAVPGLAGALRNTSMQALGHVVEGEVRHVVVRAKVKAQDLEVEKMSVWSVKDHDGKPMLTLTGDIQGLAQSLKASRQR